MSRMVGMRAVRSPFVALALLVWGATAAAPVYVTAHGKHYHEKSCRYAKQAQPVSLADAVAKKLTACAVCHKGVK